MTTVKVDTTFTSWKCPRRCLDVLDAALGEAKDPEGSCSTSGGNKTRSQSRGSDRGIADFGAGVVSVAR